MLRNEEVAIRLNIYVGKGLQLIKSLSLGSFLYGD